MLRLEDVFSESLERGNSWQSFQTQGSARMHFWTLCGEALATAAPVVFRKTQPDTATQATLQSTLTSVELEWGPSQEETSDL